MILTAEHLLHVLHIHKYFSTKPSPVILTPNKMERLSFNESAKKYAKHIIYYVSGGNHYDAATLHGALKGCLVSKCYEYKSTTQLVINILHPTSCHSKEGTLSSHTPTSHCVP